PLNNLSNDSRRNGVKSVPNSNDTKSLNENRSEQIPLTSSCSSLESTYSSSSASYKPLHTSLEKFQIGDTINTNNEEKIPRNSIQENSEYMKSSKQLKSIPKSPKSPIQNMPPMKISTAQSRLAKYPKKCEEQIKVSSS
ncbi:tudor domain-containing protein 7-like isoform X2, partial [Aphis craccivora]